MSLFRLFGFPFFDSSDRDEVVQLNKDFHMEYETIKTIKDELSNPSGKLDKEGKVYFMSEV